MTFRGRVVALSGLAVAAAVIAVSIVTYLLVRDQLFGRVDDELKRDVSETFAVSTDVSRLQRGAPGTDRGHAAVLPAGKSSSAAPRLFLPSGPLGARSVYAQLVEADGRVIRPHGRAVALGSRHAAQAVARGEHEPFYSELTVAGFHLRVYTAPFGRNQAIQIARPLGEVDTTLRHLALILAAVSLGGIALAGVLGYLVSRAAVVPVERLRRTAQEVASTRDFHRRIEGAGHDEIAQLATSFNQMLAALEDSLGAQRQLVADASHELRTPLASLRTNVEVLEHSDLLADEERRALLGDVVGQIEELTDLIGDLIDLARASEPEPDRGPPALVRLDRAAAGAVERAGSRFQSAQFELDASPAWVRVDEERLERALTNLLDNAVKWSPPGGTVEVTAREGTVAVRDHGPGISADDLPHVFDRFYRSASARGLPGSGLGLAIVKQVVETAGGSVSARNAAGGGAVLTVTLPVVEAPELAPAPA
jgi:two-component system, OmpR family, sensor histidine kinase MprB